MQTDQALVKDCLSYDYVIFGGLTVTVFYHLFSAVLRAVGDSRTPLIAIAVSSCVNIGLDFLFLFVFDTGVAGPAWATIIAQLVSVWICRGRLFQSGELRVSGCDHAFIFERRLVKELLRNGVPMALMNSVTSVGCIFVQSCINRYGVIFFGLPAFGFTAVVYAEGMAWIGALSLNLAAYLRVLGRMEKTVAASIHNNAAVNSLNDSQDETGI